jgi:HrpA-like RNA helicase
LCAEDIVNSPQIFFSFSSQTKSTLTSLFKDQCIDLDLIVSLIRVICTKEEGAILVFLPGWDQIVRLRDKLMPVMSNNICIRLLHGGMMSTEEQQEVFKTAPPGVRKIVISTNVAETR